MSKDNFNIENKNIIICGGSGQLGSSLINFLLEKRSHIINLDIFNLKINHPNYQFFKVDVAKEKNVLKVLNKINRKYKKIDVLINVFHFKGHRKLKPFDNFFNEFHNYPLKTWKKTIDVNLNGLFIVCQNVLKNMLKKAAIINFTKYIATHYADKNIRANVLSPGGIDNVNQSKYFKREYNKRTPMKRMANVNEFNETVLYLISSASRYVTGSNLVVDGGWTAW